MFRCITIILVALALMSEVSMHDFSDDYHFEQLMGKNPEFLQYVGDKEYIHHIHSMIDAYRGDIGGRLVIETNELIDTKYRTWKRNADLINSLLALPKGMNDAGR